MKSATGSVLAYATLPRVLPRFRQLAGGGKGNLAFWLLSAAITLGLLPPSHRLMKTQQPGAFGIGAVFWECAAALRFSWANIDKIIIFSAFFGLLALLALQMGLAALSLFIGVSEARDYIGPVFSIFHTLNPKDDLAFVALDRIFGIPGFFNSCVAQSVPCLGTDYSYEVFPSEISSQFRELLAFYNKGLFFLAALIVLYHVVTVIGESAMLGKPFGHKFPRVWGPLRLIIALGLLVPMGYGLNASQWIVLHAAKNGSGMASQAWDTYLNGLDLSDENSMLGPTKTLLAKPKPPSANEILQFMSTAKVCQLAYKHVYGKEIRAWAISDNLHESLPAVELNELLGMGRGLYSIQQWSGSSNITVAFGEKSETHKADYKGAVRPYCGVVALDADRMMKPENGLHADGIDYLALMYLYNLVATPWNWDSEIQGAFFGDFEDADPGIDSIAKSIIASTLSSHPYLSQELNAASRKVAAFEWYSEVVRGDVREAYELSLNPSAFDAAFGTMEGINWNYDPGRFGWGGAAVWLNNISSMNGAFADAVRNLPYVVKLPEIMVRISEEKSKQNEYDTGTTEFTPYMADGYSINFESLQDQEILKALNAVYVMWNEYYETTDRPRAENIFTDSIRAIFTYSGLFAFRDNQDIHPLAAMSVLGKTLLTSAIVNIGTAGVAGVASLIGKNNTIKSITTMLAGLMMAIATPAILAGVVLYYIIPFLPFVYFFFAITSWIKSIFEAMLGVPLWALSHLRVGGEGFPTPQSLGGYVLIIDIFLRPVLTVFGLVGSLIVFSALTFALNKSFSTLTENITGSRAVLEISEYDPRAAATSAAVQLSFTETEIKITNEKIAKLESDLAQAQAAPETEETRLQIALLEMAITEQNSKLTNLQERLENEQDYNDLVLGELEEAAEAGSLSNKIDLIDASALDDLFYTLIYTLMVYMIALSCFKMIDLIPQNIMRWFDASITVHGFTADQEDHGKALVQSSQMGMHKVQDATGGVFRK